MGKYTYPLIIVGAAALAFLFYKKNTLGAIPIACGPESKSQAKQYMASVLSYKTPEKIEQSVVDQVTGMDQTNLMAYADLLRGRQETPNFQNYRANGIGRPQ